MPSVPDVRRPPKPAAALDAESAEEEEEEAAEEEDVSAEAVEPEADIERDWN
jgi:hypothetical protein